MRHFILVTRSLVFIPVRALGAAAAFAFVFLLPSGSADGIPTAPREYRLRLYHTHTRERIDVVYRRGDTYLPEAVAELDHFLRDHRTKKVGVYDPKVFDLLHDLTEKVGHPGAEIQVVCGYRTPWSNNLLRSRSKDVASHSLHMVPEAVDMRVEGVPTALVRKAALALRRGGVGYYSRSNFVHVDIGRVRHW